jgi:hypothetical protein
VARGVTWHTAVEAEARRAAEARAATAEAALARLRALLAERQT